MKTLQTLSVTCWGIGLHEPRCTCNLGVKLAAQYRLAMKRMRANYSTFAPRSDCRRGRPSLHGSGAAGWCGSLYGFLHQRGGAVLKPFRLPCPYQPSAQITHNRQFACSQSGRWRFDTFGLTPQRWSGRLRVMLSSHKLCTRSCNCYVGFMAESLLYVRVKADRRQASKSPIRLIWTSAGG
jgi:hypothetical protein